MKSLFDNHLRATSVFDPRRPSSTLENTNARTHIHLRFSLLHTVALQLTTYKLCCSSVHTYISYAAAAQHVYNTYTQVTLQQSAYIYTHIYISYATAAFIHTIVTLLQRSIYIIHIYKVRYIIRCSRVHTYIYKHLAIQVTLQQRSYIYKLRCCSVYVACIQYIHKLRCSRMYTYIQVTLQQRTCIYVHTSYAAAGYILKS